MYGRVSVRAHVSARAYVWARVCRGIWKALPEEELPAQALPMTMYQYVNKPQTSWNVWYMQSSS